MRATVDRSSKRWRTRETTFERDPLSEWGCDGVEVAWQVASPGRSAARVRGGRDRVFIHTNPARISDRHAACRNAEFYFLSGAASNHRNSCGHRGLDLRVLELYPKLAETIMRLRPCRNLGDGVGGNRLLTWPRDIHTTLSGTSS